MHRKCRRKAQGGVGMWSSWSVKRRKQSVKKSAQKKSLCKTRLYRAICDPTGTRTQGPFIKSEMLYRLSYWIYRFWKSVPETGLEPARPKTDTSPSSLRVYQFHHPGRVWCSLCFLLSVAKVRLFFKLQRFFLDFFPKKDSFLRFPWSRPKALK